MLTRKIQPRLVIPAYILNGEVKLILKDRDWTCPKCGKYHISDINAAKIFLVNAAMDLVTIRSLLSVTMSESSKSAVYKQKS